MSVTTRHVVKMKNVTIQSVVTIVNVLMDSNMSTNWV